MVDAFSNDKKPKIQACEQDNIRNEDNRMTPWNAADMKVRKRPQKWRGEKAIGMCRNIHKDMQSPRGHFPKRLPSYQPHKTKRYTENYQAMSDMVK